MTGDRLASQDPGTMLMQDIARVRQDAAIGYVEDVAGPELPADPPDDQPGVARRVASDVGGGLQEAGTQIIGGVRDAAHGALTGLAEFDRWASDALGLPMLQIRNEQGEFELDVLSPEEREGIEPQVHLPEIREANTVTGGMIRGVTQFLTGFAGGMRVLKGIGGATVAAQTGRAVGASGISDFAAFDGHEERLSDLVQSVPALQNPVTEYLASDMDDSELEGRLKNVAEGAMSDAILTGLVVALRGVRIARRAKEGTDAETYVEAADRLARDPSVAQGVTNDVTDLRGPDLPLTSEPRGRPGEEGRAQQEPDPAQSPNVGRVETGGGDVYINWAKIDSTDDVKAVIQQLANADKAGIDDARRGVRSNAETAKAAGDENAWDLLVERRKGDPLNAEQTLAVRRLWAASAEKLTETARLMQTAPTPENTFLFRRALALHGTVQREVLAVRAETARALQQWSIPAGPDELVARQVSETLNILDDADGTNELARQIVGLAEQGDQAAIDALSRKSMAGAVGDMVFEYWVNAVLSGPKTHMVNGISNTAVVLTSQIERLAAAGLASLRGAVDDVDAAEAGAMFQGMFAALPDAMRFASRAMVTGQSGFGMQKLEVPRQRSWSSEVLTNTRNESFNRVMNQPLIAHGINALGSVITIPGRALGASDEFFKTINYRMEVHAQAARIAQQELRAGAIGPSDVKARMADIIDDPPDHIAVGAREFAQYSTFTNDAGRYAKAINGFKGKAPILRFVMPFVNTPANILRFVGERSPGAVLLGDVRADIRAGGRRRDLALAKMGLGSFAMLTAFDAAMNGQITGAGPSNPNHVAALRRTGWQSYSVRIGDRYFAYNRVDPLGAQLGIAANTAEMALNSEANPGEDFDEAIYGAIGAIGQQMMDRTYLQGLSDLFTAMSEPKRFAPRYFERLAGSFVPAFVREIKSAEDPILRRVSDTMEEIRSRLPGFSRDLPARHDLWGREISFQSGLGKGFDAASPIYSSVSDPEPIDLALQDIDYFPALPSKRLKHGKDFISLRNQPQIYERYVVLQGATKASEFLPRGEDVSDGPVTLRRMSGYGNRTLLETLNAIVTGQNDFLLRGDGQQWADADADRRAKIVKTVVGDFRRMARGRLKQEFPDVFPPLSEGAE
ncbi:MAG: hypothetical protein AAF408_08345 [Pseudomonadota bacterium]